MTSLKKRLKVVAVVVGFVAPKGQAKELGLKVGDQLLSYDGKSIGSREDLRAAIKAAKEGGAEEIPLRVRRGEETLEFTLKPGRIGIGGSERYNEPVFE